MKKTLILFSSRHGTTRACAEELAGKLDAECQLVNLDHTPNPNISGYSNIILGGSIHAGILRKPLKKFVKKYTRQLQHKRIGLFICCMKSGPEAEQQFEEAFSAALRQKAAATGIFGGEFLLEKMNFIEKWIVKKHAGVTTSQSKIDENQMNLFVSTFTGR